MSPRFFSTIAAALLIGALGLVQAWQAHATLPEIPAGSAPGCVRSGLDTVAAEPRRYFDNLANGYAKLKRAEKILAEDLASEHPQFSPARFYNIKTPEGPVKVIAARTVHLGDLTIELKAFQYRSPFTHEELQQLYKRAVAEAYIRREDLYVAMSRVVDKALTAKLALPEGKMLGTGATRVNSVVPEAPGMLRRVFKGFRIEDGQLVILSDEQVLKNMQRDQLNEDLTYAIAESRKARGLDPIWTPIRTQWGDARDSALARAGVFQVAQAPGLDVWDILEKDTIPAELHRRLVEAKQLREEYDPYLMAAHKGMYKGVQSNADWDIAGVSFPVGLDPNNGSNYLSDGLHLYVVDH